MNAALADWIRGALPDGKEFMTAMVHLLFSRLFFFFLRSPLFFFFLPPFFFFFFLPSSLESGSVGVPASSFSLFSFPDPPPALHCLSFSSQSDLERTALKTFFS